MNIKILTVASIVALVLPLAAGPASAQEASRLKVLTTTTDLHELSREVGGDDAEVACLMKGPEDPHFLDARPSFVRLAAEADVLVVTGMDLEIGYEPLLLSESRNAKIQKGQPGYVDASVAVEKLEVPTGPVDRAQGDVHPQGNPHYLVDPVRGKQVAALLAQAFGRIDTRHAEAYRKRAEDFAHRVDVAMWGEALLAEQKAERLESRLAKGKLLDFLDQHGLRQKLGGFAAELAPFAGRKTVAYHGTMLYFLDRFALEQIGTLEPKPGIPPSPRHLAELEERMRAENARVVIYNAYQPARTAQSVASEVGGASVRLAHMPDSVPGTSRYLDAVAQNVKLLAMALRDTAAQPK